MFHSFHTQKCHVKLSRPQAEGLLLESLERDVAERRDRLQRAKRARDAAMAETKNMKLASGLITQPELLSDVAAQKELAESLTEKVGEDRHNGS